MLLGAVILSFMGLGRGLMPHPFETRLGSAAASAILGKPVEMHLKLWHGVDPAALTVLGLSVATLALGWGLYVMIRARVAPLTPALRRPFSYGPTRLYELLLQGLYTGADRVTRLIQSGRLRYYVLVTLAFAVVVAAPPLLRALGAEPVAAHEGWRVHELVIGLLTLLAALAATLVRSRLTTLMLLGVVGTCMGLLFVLFSAPDLALTQVMIEILTVVILAMVLYRLPAVVRRSGLASRLRDLTVALGVGGMMALFVIVASRVTRDTDGQRLLPRQQRARGPGPQRGQRDPGGLPRHGHPGRDHGARRGRAGRDGAAAPGGRTGRQGGRVMRDSLILRTATRLLMPLLLLFSLFSLLRGHNEPGGGFIGGLLAAGSLCLYLLAHGPEATRRVLRIDPRTLIGGGLLAALGAGLAPLFLGQPFLTGLWAEQPVPGIGKVSTVLLFDIGVYLVVAGTTLLMVLTLSDRGGREEEP